MLTCLVFRAVQLVNDGKLLRDKYLTSWLASWIESEKSLCRLLFALLI